MRATNLVDASRLPPFASGHGDADLPSPRLGFVLDVREGAERVYTVAEVDSATHGFGGNVEAICVLEVVAGLAADQLRFALRTVAVAELVPGLLDTDAEHVARLSRVRERGARLSPVVVAGALLVDGNHRTALAAASGEATIDAFVLLPAP